MSKFSVIIPVYNRPDEVVELLESLTRQTAQCDVEVVIVEDGSKKRCENEVLYTLPTANSTMPTSISRRLKRKIP